MAVLLQLVTVAHQVVLVLLLAVLEAHQVMVDREELAERLMHPH
jgi:hypothetical protein